MLLLAACAALLSLLQLATSLELSVVVISGTHRRYVHALKVLEQLNLTSVRHHLPQPFLSPLIANKWHSLYPESPDEVPSDYSLKVLSLCQANEDGLDMVAGEALTKGVASDHWWLVFEDDIVLGAEPTALLAAMEHVLALAHDDGVATMGTCLPQPCILREVVGGVEFAKCVSFCTHAMAWRAARAAHWRLIFGKRLAEWGNDAKAYAVDLAIMSNTKESGGIWSAGINLKREFGGGDHFGLFQQERRLFGSLLNPVEGEGSNVSTC
jgi:hypothetical protein